MPRKKGQKKDKPQLKIAVLIPTGGNPEVEFVHSLLELIRMFNQGNIPYTVLMLTGSCIHVNREKLVEDAFKYAPAFTHALFLDDDMEFTPKAVVELFKAGEPFVGVTYRKRIEMMDWTATKEERVAEGSAIGVKVQADGVSTDVVDCLSMGFGVTLIARQVFESMPQPWFPPFWDNDIKDYRGEDEAFCYQALERGWKPKISLAASNHVGHIGKTRYDYKSSYTGIAHGCSERKVTSEAA